MPEYEHVYAEKKTVNARVRTYHHPKGHDVCSIYEHRQSDALNDRCMLEQRKADIS